MIQETDPDGEHFSQWLSNPVTGHVVAGLQGDLAKALTNLIGAARMSTDPKVTTAVTYFDTLNKVLLTLTPRKEEEHEAEREDDG